MAVPGQSTLDTTDALKRSAYLIGLPLGIVACLIGWLLEAQGANGMLSRWPLLWLPVWLAAMTIGFAALRDRLQLMEILLFGSLCVFLMTGLGLALHAAYRGELVAAQLGEFGYWFPTVYALAFLSFGVRRGRRVALTVFTISLAAGFFYLTVHLLSGQPVQELRGLGQLYLASAVVILVFITFARLVETHQGIASDMEWLANTDQLTRIPNRRRTEGMVVGELERSARYDTVFSVVLIDIDHFKRINDRFGHAAGDQVLRRVSELLRRKVRAIDHVGRWGGEEFLVVTPGIELRDAVVLATRLKSLVGAHPFDRVGKVTLSMGVATFEEGDDLDSLLQRADGALYRAKAEGRDRVMAA